MKKLLPDSSFGNPDVLAKLIKEVDNVKLSNRLNAIRLLMLDYSIKEVSEISGRSRRCVEKWVKKWNQKGKEGLVNKNEGSRSKVTKGIRAEISEIVDLKIETDGGKIVTGKLIRGYLKKTPNRD